MGRVVAQRSHPFRFISQPLDLRENTLFRMESASRYRQQHFALRAIALGGMPKGVDDVQILEALSLQNGLKDHKTSSLQIGPCVDHLADLVRM